MEHVFENHMLFEETKPDTSQTKPDTSQTKPLEQTKPETVVKEKEVREKIEEKNKS